MYDRYFSASDCTIDIESSSSAKTLRLDKVLGIGFSESAPVTPIYTLGRITSSFFTKNNTIVQGSIIIPLMFTTYLKKAIMYLYDLDKEFQISEKTPESFDEIVAQKNERVLRKTYEIENSKSILQLAIPFNIRIRYSFNEDINDQDDILITDCILTGRVQNITNDTDGTLVDIYHFTAKQIY